MLLDIAVSINRSTWWRKLARSPYCSIPIRVSRRTDSSLRIFSWTWRKCAAVVIRNRTALLNRQIILLIIRTKKSAFGSSRHGTSIESCSRCDTSSWRNIPIAHSITWKLGKSSFKLIPFVTPLARNAISRRVRSLSSSRFRNGGYESAPLIGKYCGTEIPTEIPSQTNQMYIKFVSDYSRSMEGFYIEWDSTTMGKRNFARASPTFAPGFSVLYLILQDAAEQWPESLET